MRYIVTKKQVEEMYNTILNNWQLYKEEKFNLALYNYSKKTIHWTFYTEEKSIKNKDVFYIQEDVYGMFEWVVLKEIGGRRKYTKKELIDGIQSCIHNNYLKSKL